MGLATLVVHEPRRIAGTKGRLPMKVTTIGLIIFGALLGIPAAPTSAAAHARLFHDLRLTGLHLTTSTNWSGYATETNLASPQSGAISDVRGTWTVPSVVCGGAATYSASWVGIDGYADSTVEQTGTEQDCSGGVARYSAWYEMYPKISRTVPLSVHAGDTMSAEVRSVGSDNFQLTLTDANDGPNGVYTTTQKLARAQLQSAEWIVEAPSQGGILTLASFGSETFIQASVTINGTTGSISSGQYDPITMVSSTGTTLAAPSKLTSGGASFTDTYAGQGSIERKSH
jgi:hypothetical protein